MRAADRAAARAETLGGIDVPPRVWGATLLSALGRQWGALCTFLALAVLARVLAPADFGRFTFWLAVLSVLDVLVDCGTSSIAVQRGAREPALFGAALSAGRRIRAGSALIGTLAVGLAAGLLGEQELAWVLLAAALAAFARVPEMSAVVFQRDIAWGRPLLLRALGASARLVLVVFLATRGVAGFGPYLLAHAASLALGNVALHLAARARLPRAAAPLPGMLASAVPLALTGLVQQAYFFGDNAFVRAFAGEEELGRYNAAVRLFLWLAFFAAFATTSALPWLAARAARGELGSATARLAQPLFLAACVAAGALLPWSAFLLRFAFGPGFEQAAPSLGWLLAAVVMIYPGAAFLTAVIAAGRTRLVLGIAALALLVNVAGNALAVPRFGAEGAAMVTLLTESTVTFGALLALRSLRAWPAERPLRWVVGPLLLGLAMLGSRTLFAALFAA